MKSIRAKLSRKELYERIWKTPSYKLARELNVSVRSVYEACRAHKIPTPKKPYWFGRNAGTGPRQPLPNPDRPDQIVLWGFTRKRKSLRFKNSEADVKVPTVVVDHEGPLRHPLTLRTQWLLETAKPDDAGVLVSQMGLAEHLRVSAKVLPRALRILDALFVAFSEHPFGLNWPEGNDKKLDVIILGESFRFHLDEIILRTRRSPTKTERLRQRQNWLMRPSRYKSRTARRLKLIIAEIHGKGVHHTWADLDDQPLEECLQNFLGAIVVVARDLKEERGERGSWRRQWDKFRAQELEQERRREEAARKLALLRQSLTDWAEAETLREFVSRLEKKVKRIRTAEERRLGMEMLAWMRQERLALDPMLNIRRLIATLGTSGTDIKKEGLPAATRRAVSIA